MRTIGRIAAVTALLAAACAPAAHGAQTPITIGAGVNPRVVVTPNGTAHVVWSIPPRGLDSAAVGYCRLPPGATACEGPRVLLFPSSGGQAKSGGDVTIQADGDATLRIVSACYTCAIGNAQEGIQRWTSTDAGGTFGGEPSLGGTPTNAGMGPDGITVPGGVYVTPADGDQIIARPGTPDSATVDAAAGASFVHSPSIVRVPGQTKLVYATSDLFGIRTAIFRGPDFAATTLMDPAHWTVGTPLVAPEPGIREPRLTAGAAGVWLSYEQKLPLDDHVLLRRLDPAKDTFGSARTVESAGETDSAIDDASSAQDPAGRLHVVWRTTLEAKLLRYARSAPAAGAFTAPVTLAQGETFMNPEVAAGPDGTGLAVWQGLDDSPIRALRIDGTGTGDGASPGPGEATGAATKTVSVTVSGARITLRVPSGCVRRGGTFRALLSWKRIKKKGSVFVKITRTDFYVGSRRAKIDRRAPFSQLLTVPRSAARGGRVAVRARAFIKVKRGRAPKKSIGTTVKVCS